MGDVVDFINPFGGNFLGTGGAQQTQSGSDLRQQSFAQFPDLQKAIAQFGFENIRALSGPLAQRIDQPTPTLPLTPEGLFPQQQQAFRTAVQQALGTSSSDFARRGFLRPENINAIAGSAAQNVMPQFLPLISQNVVQAALTPEQVTQNRINQLMQLIGIYPGLLGGIGTQISTGQTNFPSFMQTFGTNMAQGLGQSAARGIVSMGGGGTG